MASFGGFRKHITKPPILRAPQAAEHQKTQDIPGDPRIIWIIWISSLRYDEIRNRFKTSQKYGSIWFKCISSNILNIFTCSQYSQFRAVMLSSEHRRLPQQRFKADGDFASDLQSMDAHLAQIRSDPDQAQSQ